MTKPLGRDEQMYCTAAVLLAQGRTIYRDFSYPAQLPYHPLLYAALFRVMNTNHYLLVGRMVSVVCDILVMVCIVGIYRHIFRSFEKSGILFGLAGAVLYVFNPLVDYANGYAWNHDVVILSVALSFWLFVSIDFQQKSKYWKIAAIGALLTLATCMRITTALVELLFFVVLLSQPAGSIKQRCKTVLPFVIAEAVVLIWPVWVIAQAPRAFSLNLYWIPKLYGKWLHEVGLVYNKVDLILSCITQPGYIVLIVIASYLCLVIAWQRSSKQDSRLKKLYPKPYTLYPLLAALLPLIFFIIALIPPTMWLQYLAMPVPFLIISLAYPLFYLSSSQFGVHFSLFKISYVLLGVCAVVAVVSYPVVLYRTPLLLVPESWEPIALHKISEDIGQKLKTQNHVLSTAEGSKLILTLAPLFALEAGCDIYTELSCGAIIYRVADFMSPSDRAVTHTVGTETLAALLEKSPPSAVILGFERGGLEFLEAPLQAAIKPDWERKAYENGLVVYFRP
jgi:hypothetical protein